MSHVTYEYHETAAAASSSSVSTVICCRLVTVSVCLTSFVTLLTYIACEGEGERERERERERTIAREIGNV